MPHRKVIPELGDGSDGARGAASARNRGRWERQASAAGYAAKLQTGGFDEALTRAVLYVIAAERTLDQRSAFALNVARQRLMHLSLAAFKTLVRERLFVLRLERAIDVLGSLVPDPNARTQLLDQAAAIVGAGKPPGAAERTRPARRSEVLAPPAGGNPNAKPAPPPQRPWPLHPAARP